ncbi:hypothetical protein [Rhodopirellula sp. SWK7]
MRFITDSIKAGYQSAVPATASRQSLDGLWGSLGTRASKETTPRFNGPG